jgi:hypothetical protein
MKWFERTAEGRKVSALGYDLNVTRRGGSIRETPENYWLANWSQLTLALSILLSISFLKSFKAP